MIFKNLKNKCNIHQKLKLFDSEQFKLKSILIPNNFIINIDFKE